MRNFFYLLALLFIVSGCAVGGGSLSPSSLSFGTPDIQPAPETTTVASPASEPSVLSDVWSNFSASFRSGQQPAAKREQAPPKLDTQAALRMINEYRASKGLKALTLEPKAAKAAQMLSEDMAKNDKLSHYGPKGADVSKRLNAAGYTFRLAAENVGAGQTTLAEMIQGWKNSPPHSKNMLLPGARHMGIAVHYRADAKYKTYWTLVLAAP